MSELDDKAKKLEDAINSVSPDEAKGSLEGAIIMAEVNVIIDVLTQHLGRKPTKGDLKKVARKFARLQGKKIQNEYLMCYGKKELGFIRRVRAEGAQNMHIEFEPLNKKK